ncbi:hypothetical protein [Rahnella victoriana]|uniref:hypothetical protein n=1 Tax=Rahnella victoriana TaxID=1510570 RepID=UPI0010CE005E|nr:hypothetical protein [Rahnella victoriana]UHM90389.1 hypothetical protein J9880_19145 [Rahnella victoriana]VTQ53303.1 Uncharacterised protein [Campylobacter jejuni]
MHTREMIHQAYDSANEKTLSVWNDHPGTGAIRTEPFYHPTRLAITSGNLAGAAMAGLLQELETAAQGDPLADIAPLNGMHFTFFAVTQALYARPQDEPRRAELIAIFEQHCAGHIMQISDLRLVALPDQLLLAGTPDEKSLQIRQSLVDHLLDTPWASKIKQRYPNGAIPQIFWHSTVLRYSAQYLPEGLRTFFLKNQHRHFGSLSLPVKLKMTNYNWTDTVTLA